jgi:hypothetical protein
MSWHPSTVNDACKWARLAAEASREAAGEPLACEALGALLDHLADELPRWLEEQTFMRIGPVAEGVAGQEEFIVDLIRETKGKLGGRHINVGVTFAVTMLLELVVESERLMGERIDWDVFVSFLTNRLDGVRLAVEPTRGSG